MERPPNHGIYSAKLLGLREHCSERGCPGVMESTGFLIFDQNFPPEQSWAIEYACPVCDTIAPIHAPDKLPLVREVLRPIFED